VPASIAYIKSGRMRPLGVTTPQRAPALPDVPTIAEAGLPRFEVSGWYGVIGPRAIPRPLVERLNRDINATLQVPEVAKLLLSQGATPKTGTADDFARSMSADRKKWADVVRKANVKIN